MKKKTIRANQAPYITKSLRKAIMKRTQLANKYHKTRLDIDNKEFRKQKNFVNRLYKREKKNYYGNLSMGSLKDNKLFWKNMKPLFSDRSCGINRITLVKDETIISNELDVAKLFSNQFKNAVSNLNIPEIQANETGNLTDEIDICIEKFKNHPSILKIQEKVGNCDTRFEFQTVSEEEVIMQFKNLKRH